MQIAFFCVYRKDPQPYVLADLMIASARRVMPGIGITQLTDELSPPVRGVDEVRRLPHGPMLERRLEHYAGCLDDDWLLVDTDVEFRADVRDVFPPTPFDLALADRHWPAVGDLAAIPQGDDVMHTMPFNTGVCFSRNPQFWADVLAMWRNYPTDKRDWMSEQRAVYDVIRTGQYLLRILPGQQYNYPPRTPADPCADAKIIHHKGPRKQWWVLNAERARYTTTPLALVPA